MDAKKCCDCKNIKNINEFYRYRDGLQSRCKECTKLKNRKFKEKNPNYHKSGGPGYSYSKMDKERYNKDRYKKYKNRYEEYNDKFRHTIRGSLYNVLEGIRSRCKKNRITNELDLDYLVFLYEKQNGTCFSTGLPFDLSKDSRKKRFRPFSVSIDRIDPLKGYTKDNCRLVCVAFNLALNAFGEDTFEKIAKAYLEYKARTKRQL